MSMDRYRVAIVGEQRCGKSTFRKEICKNVTENIRTFNLCNPIDDSSRQDSISFELLDPYDEIAMTKENGVEIVIIFYRRNRSQYYYGDRKKWMDYLVTQKMRFDGIQSVKYFFICGVDFDDKMARYGFDIPELNETGDITWCDGCLILGNKDCCLFMDCIYAFVKIIRVIRNDANLDLLLGNFSHTLK